MKSDTIDILHYGLHLDLKHLSKKSLQGEAVITAVPKIFPVTSFSLDLLMLQVDTIIIDGQAAVYSYNDTVIHIQPATPLTDTFTLIIGYQGTPVVESYNWGGFHFLNDSSLAYNLGVAFEAYPHNYGRVWYPCIDDFIDRATYDFFVKVKPTNMAVCGGILQSVSLQPDGFEIYHWQLEQPIPSYLVSVAVADFAHLSNQYITNGDTIPIDIYVRHADSSNAITAFSNLPFMLETFEDRFGPYRWPRVGYTGTIKGAMEHAMNIAFPRNLIQNNHNYDWLVAHELSHHWFGNLVTCASAEDMWINEGWARYCEAIFTESINGGEAYKSRIMNLQKDVIVNAHTGVGDGLLLPLYPVPQTHTYGTTVYDKGGIVVHTLRGYLGDSVFFSAIKNLLDSFAFQPLSSYQMRDFLSAETGINMTDFFEGWVFEPGFPHFSIDSVNVLPNGNNFDITVFVRQKLRHRALFTNTNIVEIGFVKPDFSIAIERMNFSGQTGVHTFTLNFNPAAVLLDPEERLSDAITAETKILKNTGLVNYPSALFKADIKQLADSILLRAEHNWVSPDQLSQPLAGLSFSTQRYWKISGVEHSGNIIDGQFYYSNKPEYDNDIFNSIYDSLVIYYRKCPGEEWQPIPFTKTQHPITGYITVENIQTGEYALAVWDKDYVGFNNLPEKNNSEFSIYPNPANEFIEIVSTHKNNLSLKIFSLDGSLIFSDTLIALSAGNIINTSNMPQGLYMVTIQNADEEMLFVKKIAVKR